MIEVTKKFYVVGGSGLYVLVVFIVAPIILIRSIEPEWLGRFIAVGLEVCTIPLAAFWITFDRNMQLIRKTSPLYQKYGDRAEFTMRAILFILGIVAIFMFTQQFPLMTCESYGTHGTK